MKLMNLNKSYLNISNEALNEYKDYDKEEFDCIKECVEKY